MTEWRRHFFLIFRFLLPQQINTRDVGRIFPEEHTAVAEREDELAAPEGRVSHADQRLDGRNAQGVGEEQLGAQREGQRDNGRQEQAAGPLLKGKR